MKTVLSLFFYILYQQSLCVADERRCHPQGTPLYGSKWCNFTLSSDELGSKCYFSCNEGYYLTKTQSNECIEIHLGMIRMFDKQIGACLPRPPSLKPGENGPFQLRVKMGSSQWGVINGKLIDSYLHKSTFFVKLPGLNKKNNTVSIYTGGKHKDFVVAMEDELVVDATSTTDKVEEKFSNQASFIFHQDLFYPGFASFESSQESGKFITTSKHGDGVIVLTEPQTVMEKQRASFQWAPA